ncbi:MAG TPA: MlaD family protein [Solirubrobacteraceae bacterium]|nr:MlaD family protein [Solirubrobacteraceae bacterium]
MKRAIKNHAGDFSAIIVLLVLAVIVTGYVLNHQGLRFPLLQSAPFSDYVVLQTGQAITPGQGQSVRVSGVQIGTIGNIQLQDGRARVRLDILPRYRHLIHTDATALLRPRTGLDDMFIEVNPGTRSSPVAREGFTIPMGNSLPDVSPDEVLAELDSDTRAYLDQLVTGAGLGLKNRGDELAQVFQRFEPTHRDLARVNQAVAVRGRDLQQLVNSLARLNAALAAKTHQITQLIDSSATVFHAFASEDTNVSQAVALLPGTLRQTTQTLQKVQAFAQQLGPAAQSLLPAARSLPAANAALRALAVPSTPIIRNQIRPFVIAARPVIRSLRPAAVDLANATPNLATSFRVVNDFVNMLGYNPGTKMHGYLWWLAWTDHNARSLFSSQDANGDFRNLFLQMSCASAAQVANQSPLAEVLYNLTPILTNAGLCPKQAAASATAFSLQRQNKLPKWARNTNTSGAKVPFLSKLPTN